MISCRCSFPFCDLPEFHIKEAADPSLRDGELDTGVLKDKVVRSVGIGCRKNGSEDVKRRMKFIRHLKQALRLTSALWRDHSYLLWNSP